MSARPDPRLRRALEDALPDPLPRPGAKTRIRAAIAAHTEASRRFLQTRGYFAAAALAALVVVAMVYVRQESPRAVTPSSDIVRPVANTASTLVLSSGANVLVQPGSDVRVERDDEHETSIRLGRGRMVAQVSKREGRPFVVRSHDVRVEVVGTIFAVEARDPAEVSVSVVAGMVDVSRGGETRRLAPGEAWPSGAPRLTVTPNELAWAATGARAQAQPQVSGDVPVPAHTNEAAWREPPEVASESPHRPAQSPPKLPREPPPLAASGPPRTQDGRPPSPYGAAKELESKGDLEGALDAYDAVAKSADKNAEDALFAAARLRAKLADTDGALEAFRSYRRRYPDGSYARVVAVHVLDLLVKKGDDHEILDEANEFLVAYPNDLRAWRFRMARAAIAIKKGDCPSAVRDLDSVPDAEATPLRRRCQASTGSNR
jgi:hypothetical protein